MATISLVEGIGNVFIQWLGLSTFIFLRYAVIAGIATALFYGIFKKKKFHLKIQQKYPKMSKVWEEVKHSSSTALIFGFLTLGVNWMTQQGWTQIYTDFSEYGVLYAVFSFVVLMFVHDAYFYWTHYSMHKVKPLMKFHAIHHKSHNPTPWAAMAFHPVEAVVEFGFIPLLVIAMPFHPIVLILFGMFSFVFNVIGHLGFEIFPKGMTRHSIGKWINTSTHHNMHHKNGNGNFGLYFNIWDTIMGTNHKNYLTKFDEVMNREKVVEVEELETLAAI
jgi:lathosterol oxidase